MLVLIKANEDWDCPVGCNCPYLLTQVNCSNSNLHTVPLFSEQWTVRIRSLLMDKNPLNDGQFGKSHEVYFSDFCIRVSKNMI